MSTWSPADGRELRLIRIALCDIRDVLIEATTPGLGNDTPPEATDGAIPGQIPLEPPCEHRLQDVCCMPFGATTCATCPTPPVTE